MGSEEGRIIKPPMEDVTSGRVFKPDKRFYYKEWLGATIGAAFIWMLAVGALILGAWIHMMDNSGGWNVFFAIFFDVLPILSFWFCVSLVFWWLPIMVGIPLYIRSIEYSVISKRGTVMPEIYVKKGDQTERLTDALSWLGDQWSVTNNSVRLGDGENNQKSDG